MGYMVEEQKLMLLVEFIEKNYTQLCEFCGERYISGDEIYGYFMGLTRTQRKARNDLSEYIKLEKSRDEA
jgi:hypothetical protein